MLSLLPDILAQLPPPPPSLSFLQGTPPHRLRSLLHHPRYAQHAQKALCSEDRPALLCLLAILPPQADTEDPSEAHQHSPSSQVSLRKALEELPIIASSRIPTVGVVEEGWSFSLDEEEAEWTRKVEEKEEKLRSLRSHFKGSLMAELEEEERLLRLQLEEANKSNEQETLNVVRKWEEAREKNRKGFANRLEKVEWEAAEVETRLTMTHETLTEGRKGLRTQREALERSLRRVIRSYDAAVSSFDSEFLQLETRAKELEEERLSLEELRKEVDERFDEMVRLRRLKELLKNLERADGVRKNWAARRIQEAWRRYKIQKFRRKKLRGKKTKKGKK